MGIPPKKHIFYYTPGEEACQHSPKDAKSRPKAASLFCWAELKTGPYINGNLAGYTQEQKSPKGIAHNSGVDKKRNKAGPHQKRNDEIITASIEPKGVENQPDDHTHGYGI